MSEMDPFDYAKRTGKPVEIDADSLLHTMLAKENFLRRGMLLVYDLKPNDVLELELNPPVHEVDIPERIIKAELWDCRTGLFHVMDDTDEDMGIKDTVVNFGTYAQTTGDVYFSRSSIIRGLVQPRNFMAIDLRGQHFFDEGSEVQISSLAYVGLSVNGVPFFKV
jgi:hypothetical protein